MDFSIIISTWIVTAVVTAIVASSRGRNWFAWLIIGFCLSLLGIVLVALLPSVKTDESLRSHRVACPFCAEPILPQAKRCKHCGSDVVPAQDKIDSARNAAAKNIPEKRSDETQNDYIDRVVNTIGATRTGDTYEAFGTVYHSFGEMIKAVKKED